MVCPQYYPSLGGYETLAHLLARQLRALEVDCLVVTKRLRAEWPPYELHEGVPIRRLFAARARGLDGPSYVAGLARYLVGEGRALDVVHVHQIGWGLVVATLLGRLTGVPVVAHPHSGAGATVRAVRASGRSRLLRWALTRVDGAIALGDEMAGQLRSLGVAPERIHLIGNAVDTERFRPAAERAATPSVLYVGRLSPEKGVDVLLRAWALVLQAHPTAHLRLVGDGPERGALEALAARLGLAEGVSFAGAVRQGLVDEYQRATIFVLPSHREGVSIALLEAMACGLPVVATAVGGTPEVVHEGVQGLLVPPGDPAALAGALRRCLAAPQLAAELGRAGRERVVGAYAAPLMAQQVRQLYGRIGAERRRPGDLRRGTTRP